MKKFMLASAALSFSASFSIYAASLSGVLVSGTGDAVINATIKIHGTDKAIVTDAQGKFDFGDLPQGQYTLDIEAGAQGHYNIPVYFDGNNLGKITVDDQDVDHMVVHANPLEHSSLRSVMPVALLTEEELINIRAVNLAETISKQAGVQSSSFGSGSGKPIVRGQSGNRVRVMQGGTGTLDVSGSGPDHNVASEPLLADQIEVLRGPATLLFGTTASGGAINVVDGRIPQYLADETTAAVELRTSSVDSGKNMVARVDGAKGKWGYHFDAFWRDADDYKTPAFHAEHEENESAEAHEELTTKVENSFAHSTGITAGTAYFKDDNMIGFSVNQIDSEYGLPGHGHHDEAIGGALIEEEILPFIEMQQTRYDLKAKIANPMQGIETYRFSATYNDYQHKEIEDGAVGTVFTNKGFEARGEFNHVEVLGWHGVIGFQYLDRDFFASGEEAYIAPSTTKNIGIFALEEKNIGNWHLEAGARYETQDTSSESTLPDYNESGLSGSVGASYSFSKSLSLKTYYTHSSRLPAAEELYADGFHVATNAVELGLYTLNQEFGLAKPENETASNLDIGIIGRWDNISMTMNVFQNTVDNYAYLVPMDIELLEGDAHSDEHEHEALTLGYVQRKVEFIGAELDLKYKQQLGNLGEIAWGVGSDYVRAEESESGAYLPRQSPFRWHVDAQYQAQDWSLGIEYWHYEGQSHVASLEETTDDYQLVNLSFNYFIQSENSNWMLFINANNLTDELAYDHTSFIKEAAPKAGRNIVAGVRVGF